MKLSKFHFLKNGIFSQEPQIWALGTICEMKSPGNKL